MVLRCSDSRLMFIDSTANGGVALNDMDQFVEEKYYNEYTVIAYRHLHYKRTLINQRELEVFLRVRVAMTVETDRKEVQFEHPENAHQVFGEGFGGCSE